MRNHLKIIILGLMMGMGILIGCDSSADDQSAIIEKAETYIDLLVQGEYEQATENYDSVMKDELTPAALEELWDLLVAQAGEFIDQEFASIEKSNGYQVVLINGLFEATEVTFTITFDQSEKIAGFFIQ